VDGVTLNGSVNPNGHETTAWFKWGTDPNFSNGFTTTNPQALAAGTAPRNISFPLMGQSIGYFQAVASNIDGEVRGEVKPFSTTPGVPGAATGQASDVTGVGAVLNGTVNPNGLSTNAWFEWGEEQDLASFSTTAVQPMGVGVTGQPLNAALSGLSAGTTYYFRVAAENTAGSANGTISSFTPAFLPTVTTDPADSITVTEPSAGATFHGMVNPNGVATNAWFKYGTDPSLGSYSSTPPRPVGSATTDQPVSFPVNTLQPWRTYYFRVVAENMGGTQEGEIVSFTTGDYYVAVGDSITGGTGDDIPSDDTSSDGRNTGGGFEPILNDLLTLNKGYPHTVVNEGVGGDTSADGASWISTTLLNHPSAKYYLVMYGTNDADINTPVSRESYKNNMQTILSAILAAGKIPYLAKVPYTTDPLTSTTIIQEYNVVIDELASENGITTFTAPNDFYTYFKNNPGELPDGIHPNGAGYQSMAALWLTALTAPWRMTAMTDGK
jgi:lysophospholipase L1-like esterase